MSRLLIHEDEGSRVVLTNQHQLPPFQITRSADLLDSESDLLIRGSALQAIGYQRREVGHFIV